MTVTAGANALGTMARALSVRELARRAAVDPKTIRRHFQGKQTPPAATRAVYASALGIAPELWDGPSTPVAKPDMLPPAAVIGAVAAPPVVAVPIPPAVNLSAVAVNRSTLDRIDRQLAGLENAEVKNAGQLASLYNARSTAAKQLSRLTGEDEITEAQIVRSSAWRAVMALLEPVLDKHPDCASDIADLLSRLEAAH